jgi:hypothetical protein
VAFLSKPLDVGDIRKILQDYFGPPPLEGRFGRKRKTGARKVFKNYAAIGSQAAFLTLPERGGGGKRQNVGQKILHLVHDVGLQLPVRNPNVDMHSEDQQLTHHHFQVTGQSLVAGLGSNLLFFPAGERMRPGGDDTALVTLTVNPVNDLPTAVDDTYTVEQDSGPATLDVLVNDTFSPDPGEVLAIVAVSTPSAGGTATNNGTSIEYAPLSGFSGTETFTYTINDGTPGSDDSATVTMTVTRFNNPPLAGDDAFTVDEDSGTTSLDVLANDTTDPDPGETLTITAVTQGSQGGTVTVIAVTSIGISQYIDIPSHS